jgi:predicted phage gp36 major capsid-like protein
MVWVRVGTSRIVERYLAWRPASLHTLHTVRTLLSRRVVYKVRASGSWIIMHLTRRSSEAAELRTRLELTERAESSLREALEQKVETEQLRRVQAEQERDELRRRLESLQELRDALKTGAERDTGTETPASDAGQPRRSWWRRFFGFE